MESWNPGILSYNRRICYYRDIIIILMQHIVRCDNLILGELAEADLGNILSAYILYVAEFNMSILMPIYNNINAVRASK
jgi:hypothetical protein